MAFPCGVATSLIENARPTRQYLSPAKTQQENELVHVRPTSATCASRLQARRSLQNFSISISRTRGHVSAQNNLSLRRKSPEKIQKKVG